MPAATTHAEFAKSVYESLDEATRKKITSMPMYYLGSQGPDLLLFHRYMVLPNSLNRYGGLMHDKKVRETISYLKKHAVTPALRSYFMGFLTHYALDSSCHPIINAFAKKEHEENGVSESEAHFRIEGEIDAWVLNGQNRSVYDYNIYRMLKISDQEVRELGRLYHGLFEEVYELDIPAARFEEACRDCMRITRQLRPGRLKHRMARMFENTVRMPHLITGMMLTDKENAVPSVLNMDQADWVWYGVFNSTFPQLRERASALAKKLIENPDETMIKKNFNGEPLGETIL